MHSQLQESGDLEFKEKFDPDNNGEWCEIIKDAVAIANSGGGKIIFGLKNDGLPSREDISAALKIDKAKITDKIARYTGEQFGDFSIKGEIISEHEVAVWEIGGVYIPMVFTKPGTYDVGGGQQKSAFSQGSVYFRHGAKSEPGNSEDLRGFVERELKRIKESWLENIRKVVEAPAGSKVEVKLLPPGVESDTSVAMRVKLVDDPSAPTYGITHPDATHPYRLKEVVNLLNQRQSNKKVTSFDIQAVRKVHGIDSKPNYYYKPNFSSPQYSEAFVDWLIKEFSKDPEFFDKTRQEYKDTSNARVSNLPIQKRSL